MSSGRHWCGGIQMHSIDSQRQWSANFHPSGILKLVSANHKLSLEGAQEILEAKNTVSNSISLGGI